MVRPGRQYGGFPPPRRAGGDPRVARSVLLLTRSTPPTDDTARPAWNGGLEGDADAVEHSGDQPIEPGKHKELKELSVSPAGLERLPCDLRHDVFIAEFIDERHERCVVRVPLARVGFGQPGDLILGEASLATDARVLAELILRAGAEAGTQDHKFALPDR